MRECGDRYQLSLQDYCGSLQLQGECLVIQLRAPPFPLLRHLAGISPVFPSPCNDDRRLNRFIDSSSENPPRALLTIDSQVT